MSDIARHSVTYLMPYCFPARPRMLASAILVEVAAKHGLSVEAVVGRSRRRMVAYARHEFFHLALKVSPLSAASIGERYGFNHTTVLYGAASHAARNNIGPATQLSLAKRTNSSARRHAMRRAAE